MDLGPVSLTVRDVDTMLEFYAAELGLRKTELDGQQVELRADAPSLKPLLVLRQDPKAETAPMDAAGLYHYALLLPNRKSLAAAYLSLGRAGVLFEGHADHEVSEALYLADPEFNGIEIYADKPREQWKFDEDGKVEMATLPLDVDSLLREVSGMPQENVKAIPEGTRIGHVHLKVTDLGRSIAFYQEVLGLDLTRYYGSAAFLSVGGYHHHIGMNTWESLGGPARRGGWSGLESFTIEMPEARVNEVSNRLVDGSFAYSMDSNRLLLADPDGIELVIRAV
jgi:catechol 2,3-dioxygenase